MSLSAHQARREHVLAVSRDFNSQPRLSEFFFFFFLIKMEFFFLSPKEKFILDIYLAFFQYTNIHQILTPEMNFYSNLDNCNRVKIFQLDFMIKKYFPCKNRIKTFEKCHSAFFSISTFNVSHLGLYCANQYSFHCTYWYIVCDK